MPGPGMNQDSENSGDQVLGGSFGIPAAFEQ